jgi:hypothetical protein
MIQMDRNTKKITYNPYFWTYKHFAHYVKAGAKAVQVRANGGGLSKINAFKNPNGDYVLVCGNFNNNTYNLTAKVENNMWKATLPPNSFNTLLMKTGTTAVERKKVTGLPVIRTENHATIFDLNGKVVKVRESRNLTDVLKPGSYIIREQNGNRTNGSKIVTVK